MIDIYRTLLKEWENRKLPEVIARNIDLLEYSDIKPRKIIVISGFRRTGKTYLLFHLIKGIIKKKSKEKIVYITESPHIYPLTSKILLL